MWVLEEACREQGFALYIANVEKIIIGNFQPIEDYYGHYNDSEDEDRDNLQYTLDDEMERTVELTIVTSPDGAVWQKDLEWEEESILQPDWYEGRTPDKKTLMGIIEKRRTTSVIVVY